MFLSGKCLSVPGFVCLSLWVMGHFSISSSYWTVIYGMSQEVQTKIIFSLGIDSLNYMSSSILGVHALSTFCIYCSTLVFLNSWHIHHIPAALLHTEKEIYVQRCYMNVVQSKEVSHRHFRKTVLGY